MNVLGCYQFRVTRNSDLFVDEEEVKNLRTKLQGELPQRHFGDAVRLEVADNCSPAMTDFLLAQFGLNPTTSTASRPGQSGAPDAGAGLGRPPGPEVSALRQGLPKAVGKGSQHLRQHPRGDILLHHPYQSFAPVIELLNRRPRTRSGGDQDDGVPHRHRLGADAVLIRAAQKGKEVTVVVELMARFDEEANISWATKLEEVGAHVVYGVVGYKTHAKMLMIVRREEGGLRATCHLGTGNYHPRTARLYTDFGLLTCNEEIGDDVNEVFKQLTGLGKART
jgi:polyphosphate kinase